MKKILPYTEPLFSTFHCSAICEIAGNNSKQINNWMMNHYLRWRCIVNFTEYFDHIITIDDSMFWNVPIFETKRFEKEEISNCVHEKIVNLINKDYYVFLAGIDDYYITGKGNNLIRHLSHDGIILGYDNRDNTYQMAAYTLNRHFERFFFPQNDLEKSINSTQISADGFILGLKTNADYIIELDAAKIRTLLAEYLFPDERAITPDDGYAYGLNVYLQLHRYVTLIKNGELSNWDLRVFRLLYEHKKFVLKLLSHLCSELGIVSTAPYLYENIVDQAEILRLLSIKFSITNNKSILGKIDSNISRLMNLERDILLQFFGELSNDNQNSFICRGEVS